MIIDLLLRELAIKDGLATMVDGDFVIFVCCLRFRLFPSVVEAVVEVGEIHVHAYCK